MDYDWQKTQSRLVDTVRDNPLPLALIGLGLGWLVMTGMRGRQSEEWHGSQYFGAQEGLGYGHTEASRQEAMRRAQESSGSEYGGSYARSTRYGAADSYEAMEGGGRQSIGERAYGIRQEMAERGRQWRDRASEMGSQMTHRAQEWASSARENITRASGSARAQASQVAERSLHTFQEHPVMIGSMALLIGAAIGASLPRSRRENELMGRSRDEMMRRAREGGYVDKARHVGERAMEAAREGGEQALHRVADAARDAAGDAVQHVREATRDEARKQDLPGTEGYRH